jgi:hypothetical protein
MTMWANCIHISCCCCCCHIHCTQLLIITIFDSSSMVPVKVQACSWWLVPWWTSFHFGCWTWTSYLLEYVCVCLFTGHWTLYLLWKCVWGAGLEYCSMLGYLKMYLLYCCLNCPCWMLEKTGKMLSKFAIEWVVFWVAENYGSFRSEPKPNRNNRNRNSSVPSFQRNRSVPVYQVTELAGEPNNRTVRFRLTERPEWIGSTLISKNRRRNPQRLGKRDLFFSVASWYKWADSNRKFPRIQIPLLRCHKKNVHEQACHLGFLVNETLSLINTAEVGVELFENASPFIFQ